MRRPRPTKQLPFVGWICMFKNQQCHVYAQNEQQALEFAITHFKVRATQHQYINVALAAGDWRSILPPHSIPEPEPAPPSSPALPLNVVLFPNPEEVTE